MKENKFPQNLKNLRKDFKLSQQELADKLNISKQTISKYEKGLAEPNFHTLIEVSKTFNCSLDELVFGNISMISKSPIELKLIIEKKFNSLKNDLFFSIDDFFEYENNPPKNFDIIEDDINNTNNEDLNTEIAEEISPVISIDEYKSSKNSIDVDFYNENNVFIVDASPFSSDETEKVYSYGNVSAGIPTFGEDSIEDEFNIFKYDLKYDSDHYFVLKVKGESMNRLYKNGDYLLVEKSCNYNLNKPVIVFLENEATVKFVEIDDFHITIIPYSTDPKFEPIHYPLKNYNYYIAGNVVGVINIIKDN
ncbi:helix-turn-helix domain-containing protein [Paraclostridium sordellii]|uniref:helix-turn-helix domain-containing protein n=1 Tax=Paraclostridium sordellii TaxID=1505 RepID=UPI0003855150|nr:helix-turn-helix domain-containing protein [Paeniclostridium sordellii]EPZ61085.1 helix-turn-helix family protein [[Clostridium] sordellii VPI 9048] [Paeniclostridium sordellii VPI 9048]CEK40058.1 hypothetical protein JGS6382_PCS1300171 (plasmid) [[Clostridium] sordellii] [Paeniclostridium sordellii]